MNHFNLIEQKVVSVAIVDNEQLAPILKDLIKEYTETKKSSSLNLSRKHIACINTVMHDYTTNRGTRMYTVLIDIFKD